MEGLVNARIIAPYSPHSTTSRHYSPVLSQPLYKSHLRLTKVLEIWRNADAVCFDVDSTVCLDEGIDEIAEFCGAGKAVAEWTARISPGIDELIKTLQANNNDVYLISGGFRQMIHPVALVLGIPAENIFANQLLFGSSGGLWGLTRMNLLRESHQYKKMVMIGDGATDLEARKPGGADMFICYGGVQHREAVAAKADWLVFHFRDLTKSLEQCVVVALLSLNSLSPL
ncbi:hypothetical protein MKX01_017207 [Papaver californicum]|nr:hypothetical protein MKX01_017207 [Papaver californicum]